MRDIVSIRPDDRNRFDIFFSNETITAATAFFSIDAGDSGDFEIGNDMNIAFRCSVNNGTVYVMEYQQTPRAVMPADRIVT